MAFLCGISGCALLLEREYSSVVPHDEQYVEDENSDVLTVENYTGLKNAILKFVSEGKEFGVIRVYRYEGENVVEDLNKAVYEVAREDPLGAYAVDYITHESQRIVSYYELNIYITFRRTVEDMARIVRVGNDGGIKDKMADAMGEFADQLLLRVSYYSEVDFESLVSECYYEHPEYGFGLPQIAVNVYPSSGVQRIIEINFNYGFDKESMQQMQSRQNQAAKALILGVGSNLPDEEKALKLVERLLRKTAYDEEAAALDVADGTTIDKNLSYTAYGALVQKLAVSEGYAMAYKQLCDLVGIECRVVQGRRAGEQHFWNIIGISGDYYHVDPLVCALEGMEHGFLLRDEDISEQYRWNTEQYPSCNGPLNYYTLFPDAIDPAAQPEGGQIAEGQGEVSVDQTPAAPMDGIIREETLVSPDSGIQEPEDSAQIPDMAQMDEIEDTGAEQ